MKMNISKFDITDLHEGMSVRYTTVLGKEEVSRFAELSGDYSPLHVDEKFGRNSSFGKNLTHGMLLAAHFSTVVGVLLPGENALLNGIQMDFVRPVPVGSEVTISASISKIQQANRMIVLKLIAFLDGEICAEGTARVKVMSPLTK